MSDSLPDSKLKAFRAWRRGTVRAFALLLLAQMMSAALVGRTVHLPVLSKTAQDGSAASGGRITYAELGTDIDADQRIVNPSGAFAPDAAQIVCVWRVEGVPTNGGTIRFVWVAEDTGGVAPPNYQIQEKSLALGGGAPMIGNTSLSKPTKGWPPGKYRLEIYLGERLERSVTFRIWTPAEDRAYREIEPLIENAESLEGKGDYRAAAPLLERALSIAEKSFGAEHPDTAALVNNLALLYKDAGDYERSERLYRRALMLAEKLAATDTPVFALMLNNLAELNRVRGDFVQAEQLLQRALVVAEKTFGAEHRLSATTLNNLALVAQAKGDYKGAERLYERALPVLERTAGAEHPDVATLVNNLAEVYREQSDYARAEPLYRRALAIAGKALPPAHPFNALVLNNFALLQLARGEHQQAEPTFRRALALFGQALGARHANVAATLNNLALLAQQRGDYAQAETSYKQALEIFGETLGERHPNVAQGLVNLAQIAAARGETQQAVSLLTRTGEIREHNLALVLTGGSEQQKQLYLDTLYGETHLTLSFHLRNAASDPLAAKLALTTLLRRKGRALDAMSDQIGNLRRRLNTGDLALLDALAAAQSKLAALMLGAPDSAPDGATRLAAIARLEAEVRRLEGEVGARSAEFAAQTQSVTLERVQGALPPDAALVEFVRYHPFDFRANRSNAFGAARYAAYVLARDRAPAWVELGEAAQIDGDVRDLRAALSNPLSRDVNALARALDERVMQPVRKLLDTTRNVFLSPDGVLNLIPFGALVDESNRYLVEQYHFTYLTSGRDLLRLGARAATLGDTIIVADPAFEQAATPSDASAASAPGAAPGGTNRSVALGAVQFTRLPGTAGEARALGAVLPAAKVLTETRATEAAIKALKAPAILHVATHGFFLPDQSQPLAAGARGLALGVAAQPPAAKTENPLLRSGLALAGANQRREAGGEDGILTALEAAGLNLWGTRLVVLSACETGVGEVKNGEGVYGLRRALVLAGSESQVMSLWQVSDEATRDLMVEYYKRLQKGGGRAEALREVQLEMLGGGGDGQTGVNGQQRGLLNQNTEKPKEADRRHPFFWASFIQSGDWRSLN